MPPGTIANGGDDREDQDGSVRISDTFLSAVFLEMFGDPSDNPRGFDRIQVEQLFPSDRDGAKCGPFGSALKNHEYTASGVPVWNMNNVGANEFREEGCLFITEAKFRDLSTYDARNGDILVSRAGTVGRMATTLPLDTSGRGQCIPTGGSTDDGTLVLVFTPPPPSFSGI